MSRKLLVQLKFVASLSKSGKDRNIIIIPKQFKKETDKLLGKQIKVILDDEI
jgi:hypothetical protein